MLHISNCAGIVFLSNLCRYCYHIEKNISGIHNQGGRTRKTLIAHFVYHPIGDAAHFAWYIQSYALINYIHIQLMGDSSWIINHNTGTPDSLLLFAIGAIPELWPAAAAYNKRSSSWRYLYVVIDKCRKRALWIVQTKARGGTDISDCWYLIMVQSKT